jgi:hypothetical protein
MSKCLMCDEFDAVPAGPYQKGDECICSGCLEDVDRHLASYGKRLDRQAARIRQVPECSATTVFSGDVLVLRDGSVTERLRGVEQGQRRLMVGVLALLVYVAMRLAGFVS